MFARILSWLIFAVLMTVDIALSLLVVVLLYLPFVALKAAFLSLTGKAKPRLPGRPAPISEPDLTRPPADPPRQRPGP